MTTTLGVLGFAQPLALWALVLLPIVWLLLRAIPPAPLREKFPAVALLLGLKDQEVTSDRTPWWLLLLRILALGCIIVGAAGPRLNPDTQAIGQGPLLILSDASWASTQNHSVAIEMLETFLASAGQNGRSVAMIALSDPGSDPLIFTSAREAIAQIDKLTPRAFAPTEASMSLVESRLEGNFDTVWFSDGLARAGRLPLLRALETHGAVRVFEPGTEVLGLAPPDVRDGVLKLEARRSETQSARDITINVIGRDPNGVLRILEQTTPRFETGEAVAQAEISLPPEIRNRVTRIEIDGLRSAGGVSLSDDSFRRREVALISFGNASERALLLSELHYLRNALEDDVYIVEGALSDLLPANPDVIVLTDVDQVAEKDTLSAWIDEGGLLVRFAGPKLASSAADRTDEDPLLPVRLRVGGRQLGGAMSWDRPKALAPFPEVSPFFGLTVPTEVTVSTQVLAEPGPELSSRVIAQLADGTPLVTRKAKGAGQIVLFHVAANAEWSSLPLSGLFVQMLERLAVSTRGTSETEAALEGTTWQASALLDGFGRLEAVEGAPSVAGETLVSRELGPLLPPGLYQSGKVSRAINVIAPSQTLTPTDWPTRVPVIGPSTQTSLDLTPWAWLVALFLLSLDILATLFVSGRMRSGFSIALAATFLTLSAPDPTQAQDDAFALAATSEVSLAYVITGDASIDAVSQAGLNGLGLALFDRTSVVVGPSVGIDLDRDPLALFPMIYWPVTSDQPLPSPQAKLALNRYLASGGMILFDTRDADRAMAGIETPEQKKLRQIALGLDIPPLSIIHQEHVLTRSFYLLQNFPGRFDGLELWVQTGRGAGLGLEAVAQLNDGVTPVVIGGNDWAAAWAVDETGFPLLPIGRGLGGQRQRELAIRFGINLVMHVLTGNYKSDQVHLGELLERIGQ